MVTSHLARPSATLVAPDGLELRSPIGMNTMDQWVDILEGVHTFTIYKGRIDHERMKAALAAVLESAPIFGGRYSTCTAQYMPLQFCHVPGWLATGVVATGAAVTACSLCSSWKPTGAGGVHRIT